VGSRVPQNTVGHKRGRFLVIASTMTSTVVVVKTPAVYHPHHRVAAKRASLVEACELARHSDNRITMRWQQFPHGRQRLRGPERL